MEISRDVFNAVSSTVVEFMKSPRYELEAKYTGRLGRDGFTNALRYYRSQGYKEQEHKDSLDVIFMYEGHSYRVTIQGKDTIQSYCLTNKITPEMVKEALSKRLVPGVRATLIPDFSLKVDLREEVPVDQVKLNELLLFLETAPKGFRLKKRYSYTNAQGTMRYDLTLVKRSGAVQEEFMASRRFSTSILSPQEVYEVEIECISNKKNGAATSKAQAVDAQGLAKAFIKAGIELYAVVNGIGNVISNTEKTNVLASYLALWVEGGKRPPAVSHALMKPKAHFVGPQPITLELRNVVGDGLPVNTILDDYTVTEKADGDRMLLYVTASGAAYFINTKLEVFSLGLTLNNAKSCIFDGEYITRDAQGRRLKLFAMFDAYFVDGVDKRSLPLAGDAGSRVAEMEGFVGRFKDRFAEGANTLLHVKRFYFPSTVASTTTTIFDESRRLLESIHADNFVYRIDGLIFTPRSLPVGALYKDASPESASTWTKAFKWKPPAENTIDMMVRENGSSVTVSNGRMMKVYTVHVGYKPATWDPIKPKAFLEARDPTRVLGDSRYTMVPFFPPGTLDRDCSLFYGEMDEYGVVRCKNGDDISNNAIVEFAYTNDPTIPFPHRWRALRVRKDKTSPNDHSAAMNVWRSIEAPVTEDIITGRVAVLGKDLREEDVYYRREISRDKFATINMLDFHNHWVKNHSLIARYSEGRKSLMDIACGQGGDLRKWLSAGLTTVFGVDKARNNIENPSEGIYSRMLRHLRELSNKTYVFGTMDASNPITDAYVSTLRSEEDQYVGRRLLAHGPFDLVSCQFAIHYFFESATKFEAFLSNVDRFLAPGGYFMGTCLDGDRVKRRLAESETAEGRQGDRLLWHIRRSPATDDESVFGKKVSVYMESIGIETPEYLVDMSTLVESLARYNIVPVRIASFESVYNEAVSTPVEGANAYYLESAKRMSAIEKEYSFMNTMFVFQKAGSKEEKAKVVKKVVRKPVAAKPSAEPPAEPIAQPVAQPIAQPIAENPATEPATTQEAPKKKKVVKKST